MLDMKKFIRRVQSLIRTETGMADRFLSDFKENLVHAYAVFYSVDGSPRPLLVKGPMHTCILLFVDYEQAASVAAAQPQELRATVRKVRFQGEIDSHMYAGGYGLWVWTGRAESPPTLP
jgi:hypothetical protein